MSEPITDLGERIAHAARLTSGRYRKFVDHADVLQELQLYALGSGKAELKKLAAAGDEFRLMRALFGAARQYCEREKAAKSGYDFTDVAWYSPEKLADLVPLALDETWDGLTGEGDEASAYGSTDGREGGTLLAMIVDIRRVIDKSQLPTSSAMYDPETETGEWYLQILADRLGGEFPDAPGYGRGRRAMSNAAARAINENGYAA